MNVSENRDGEESRYLRIGEENETDIGMLRVRAALLSLPKANCPAGFESRLQRRLRVQDVKTQTTTRGWASGWLGVGLGFACAAVIALFVFDFNSSPTAPNATVAQKVTASPMINPGASSVAQNGSATQPGENAGEKQLAATNDSVQRQSDPAHMSPNQLLQVSGGDESPGK